MGAAGFTGSNGSSAMNILFPSTPMTAKYGVNQVSNSVSDPSSYLKATNPYQVTYGGKDLSGVDILSGLQQNYFNNKYGEYPYTKENIATAPQQTIGPDGQITYTQGTREAYVQGGYGGYSKPVEFMGDTFSTPSDYAIMQMRQPLSNVEEPLMNLLSNVHLGNLVSSNNYLDDEVSAYQQAVNAYKPYITGTNPDGTVNLFVPKGADLGLTQFVKGGSLGDNKTEYVKTPSLTTEDLAANGVSFLNDRSKIVEMLLGGGGFLNRYKQNILETPVDAVRQSERTGTNYTGHEAADELAAGDQYKTAVGKTMEYYRLKNISKQMGGGTASSGGVGAPGAAEDPYLKLFKPSLLG